LRHERDVGCGSAADHEAVRIHVRSALNTGS
jgi:hypothetical protein